MFVQPDWLEEQLRQGKSLAAIGELVGKDASTVGYWAKKYGLQPVHRLRHAPRGGIAREVLADYIGRGLSGRQIAAELGCSLGTVRHWIRRYGLVTVAAERRRELARARRDGLEKLRCPKHGVTEFTRESGGRIRCLKCRSEYVTRRRRKVKAMLVAEAGGKCQICGYDRWIGGLQFHHLDPGEKRFGIATGGVARSLVAARAEARKCILLCSNCHSEVEAGILKLPLRVQPTAA